MTFIAIVVHCNDGIQSHLNIFEELLKLPPPDPGRPAELLLHRDPLHLQQRLLPQNLLFVRPFLQTVRILSPCFVTFIGLP